MLFRSGAPVLVREVVVNDITDAVDDLQELGIRVYPNPVRAGGHGSVWDQLHVSIKLPANFKTEGPLLLSVTSLEGKLVKRQQVPTSFPAEVLLEVVGLASGTYSLHLSDARTWIAGKKFIVE